VVNNQYECNVLYHHIGGLEKMKAKNMTGRQVHHHIGGLEKLRYDSFFPPTGIALGIF
jgi:hypothetical protein